MSTVLDKQDKPREVQLKSILSIDSVKSLGVFQNFSAPADLPSFRRYNLIYGFNGTGKTTLSRVFSSLASGEMHIGLPEGGTFEARLNNGLTIKSTGNLDVLKGNMLVFNVDFVEENLHWKEGTANPVIYIGKAQAEPAAKLESQESALNSTKLKLAEAEKDSQGIFNRFAEYKRDLARLIAEDLGLARKYNATNLEADYHQGTFGEEFVLTEHQRQELRSIFTQESPLAKRSLLSGEPFGLVSHLQELREILGTTLGTMILEDLREHEVMLKWVKEGTDYHKAHDLASCLFCGNTLTEKRIKEIEHAVDGKFDELTRKISATKMKTEGLIARITDIKNGLPSVNDITKGLQTRFTAAIEELERSLTQAYDATRPLLTLIEEKGMAPNVSVDMKNMMTDARATDLETGVANSVAALNTVLEEHNQIHDEFSKIQSDARAKLKKHYLAGGQSSYLDKEGNLTVAQKSVTDLKQTQKEINEEIERLKKEVQQHGPAAEHINVMIHNYLGHKELEIGTLEEGYEIRRHGKPLTGSLSEGEKTAIALCYFLCTLNAEGRKLKNLIVVVDDPISSLDTKALNYAYNLIKSKLSQAGQLIILTHNLHFMNEAKKWMKNKTEHHFLRTETPEAADKKATATLLYLDAVQDIGKETRSTSIKILPKLLREYESEYHYLFQQILDFSKTGDGDTSYFYLMPNALRKVLEVFLTFKLPGNSGLTSKVELLASGDHGIDPVRILALDRLAQIESHGDSLDDIVTFSSMTIEEIKTATDVLLEVIQKLDKGHYESMCKICA